MIVGETLQKRAVSYLHAARADFDEFSSAIDRDEETLTKQLIEEKTISPVDDAIMASAMLDREIWGRTYLWAEGGSVPYNPIHATLDPINMLRQINRVKSQMGNALLRENKNELSTEEKVDDALGVLALIGLHRVESRIYPGWQPRFFELWSRMAPQSANAPVIDEFLEHRTKPRFSPSPEVTLDVMFRAASASFALRAIHQRMIETIGTGNGKTDYIQSGIGLIAELDGLLALYEQTSPREVDNLWHFSASPNMDFGSANPIKVDLFSLRFPKDDVPEVYLFDVKCKTRNSKQPRVKNEVNLLYADAIGNERVGEKGLEAQAGFACDSFIADNELLLSGTDYMNETGLIHLGLSVLGIHVAGFRSAFRNGAINFLKRPEEEFVDAFREAGQKTCY